MRPKLVLADEPTGNLDSHSEADVLDLLQELNREHGHTIVIVTHDPGAAAIAQRGVFLRDGRVAGEVEGGSAEKIAQAFTSLELPPTAGTPGREAEDVAG